MALVVNKKLKMEAGTITTQLGHATQGCHRVIRAMATGAASLASWDQKGSWRTIVKGKNAAHLVALET
uniref:peptidyl-tRNA hydrolase n=1 Tax=Steinernema glaseri TaxID=37863 RepID=A0A1I8ATR8_9BILA